MEQDLVEDQTQAGTDEVEMILPAMENTSPPPTEQAASDSSKESASHKPSRVPSWKSLKAGFGSAHEKIVGSAKALLKGLKGKLISKDTEYALRQIYSLLSKYTEDIGAIDLVIGLLMIATHSEKFPREVPASASRSITESPPDEETKALIALADSAIKHACASYGWKVVNGYMTTIVEDERLPTPSSLKPALELDQDQTNLKALLRHTGVLPEDVVDTQWNSNKFSPGHYVVVDRSIESVVISFRGTWGIKDSVTDLVAGTREFRFVDTCGYAHDGILQCAERKLALLEWKILQTIIKTGYSKIMVTGHSLGGGTATLFSLLLAQKHPEWKIECMAFAPAAVLSRNLAEDPEVRKIVCSLLYRHDLVPRLSVGSLEFLKRTVAHLLSQSGGAGKTALLQCATVGSLFGERVTSFLEKKLGSVALLDVNQAVAEARGECFLTPEAQQHDPSLDTPEEAAARKRSALFLFPGGRIFINRAMAADGRLLNGSLKPDKYDCLEILDVCVLSEIVISGNMFLDHLPHKMELSLDWIQEEFTGKPHVDRKSVRSDIEVLVVSPSPRGSSSDLPPPPSPPKEQGPTVLPPQPASTETPELPPLPTVLATVEAFL